jgi:hypothetical protein
VERPVFEHGDDDVGAASGEADQGPALASPISARIRAPVPSTIPGMEVNRAICADEEASRLVAGGFVA